MTPKAIRALREQLGLTQMEFGRQLGVYWITVSRWERGHMKPKSVYVRAMKRLETLAVVPLTKLDRKLMIACRPQKKDKPDSRLERVRTTVEKDYGSPVRDHVPTETLISLVNRLERRSLCR